VSEEEKGGTSSDVEKGKERVRDGIRGEGLRGGDDGRVVLYMRTTGK
jgi:hypothetical protein